MDPAIRTGLVIFAAVFLRQILVAWWERFKAAEGARPIPMKFRNGVYVPNGRVQRIERWADRLFVLWLVYVALLLVAVLAR